MTEISLQFLHNEADEEEGLGDAGIETFRDAPYASTARECGQNSSDARENLPVTIRFDLRDLPIEDLPAAEGFRATIDSCLKKARVGGEDKDIEFFEQASATLAGESLKVLEISDFNTKGLTGPCEAGMPFHSLVKARGVTSKEDPAAGGSFGIGKNAVFAISDLQTVFYSTIYLDENGSEQFLAQGKSVLISHEDAKGVQRRATGYWGAEDYEPVDDVEEVPDWLYREERGTSIFAIGFRESEGWEYRMAASLVRNFFVAIHRREMAFSVADIEISADTLGALFKDERLRESADAASLLEDYDYAGDLYDCLTSEEAVSVDLDIHGMGIVKLRILIREGLPKRLTIVRNGMIITDSLEKFGDKFARFAMYRDFVAIVEPATTDGSKLIKRLENPRHDGLSAERIPDEAKRMAAMRSMKQLAGMIRSAIREQTLSVPDQVQALDELAEFFADTNQQEPEVQDPNTLDDDPDAFVYEPKKRTSRPRGRPKTRGLGGTGGSGNGGRGGTGGDTGGGEGPGTGTGTGGTGGRSLGGRIDLKDVRNIVSPGVVPDQRTLWFTPGGDGEIRLCLYATGIHTPDDLPVATSTDGQVVDGGIELTVQKEERVSIDVTLAEIYDGPIELEAFEVVEETANAD